MKKTITLSLFLFLSVSIFAQNVDLSNKLIQQYKNGQLNAVSKDATTHDHLWLTPILIQVAINWNNLTEDAKLLFKDYRDRPTFTGTELTTESGNFRIHYTLNGGTEESVDPADANSNSIPDYVDNLISKFNTIYVLYHTTTNLTIPPSDGTNGGNAKYDIYLSGDIAGAGVYGYVAPETVIGDNLNSATLTEVDASTSFMVIRNNYNDPIFGTNPNIALSVTAAHEYMHATQMGYAQSMETWFMEVCATWAEEYAFPGYDDNFQYLMGVFGKPDVALNLENGEVPEFDGHWYSSWIFAKYLTEHTGNVIIKNIYERCIIEYAADAINTELTTNWNSNLQTLFVQYVIANGILTNNIDFTPYTYNRATDYDTYLNNYGGFVYENASIPLNYSGTPLAWESHTDGNNRLMRLSADYFTFSADRNFKITFNATTTEARLILVKIKPTSASIMFCEANQSINVTDQADWFGFLPIVVRFDKAVSNVDPLNYTLSINDATVGIEEISSNLSIFPNPVSDFVSVSSNEITNFDVSIVDVTGKKMITQNVKNKNNKIDVKNLLNGVYFLQISINDEIIKTEKIIIAH